MIRYKKNELCEDTELEATIRQIGVEKTARTILGVSYYHLSRVLNGHAIISGKLFKKMADTVKDYCDKNNIVYGQRNKPDNSRTTA